MKRLDGKVVLITVDDLGLAGVVAEAFAREGGVVAVGAPERGAIDPIVARVKAAGGACMPVLMDPGDLASCEKGVGEVVAKHKALDVVCCLAGEFPVGGQLHEYSEADFDRAMKANVTSVVHTCRFALPAMRDNGVIITLTHSAGINGVAGTSLLAATKGALVNGTRCISWKAPRGIRANSVCIGDNLVPVIPSMLEQSKANLVAVEELAPTFVFLACDESRHITGQIVEANDGVTAWLPNTQGRGWTDGAPEPPPYAKADGYMADKVVLFTAGGGGMARASGVLMARHGAKIAYTDIKPEAAEASAEAVRAVGGEAIVLGGDVLSGDDCERVVQETVKKYGKLDVLVNLVGFFGKGHETLDKVDLDTWHWMMDINLKSAFMMSKYALPEIMKVGRGAVVNTGTMAGVVARDGGAYGTSKSGVLALTRAMAADYFYNSIRTNAICPSAVETAMYKYMGNRAELPEEKLAKQLEKQRRSTQGIMRAEDIAPSFMFLASEQLSLKTTGNVLLVENGSTVIRH